MEQSVWQIIFLLPFAIFFVLASYNFFVYRKLSPSKKVDALNLKGVSVYVPVFNDNQILKSLSYFANLDYHDFKVKILDDSTNIEIKNAIDSFIKNKENFSVIRRPTRLGFKGGAIENALKNEQQPLICVIDCDFHPQTDFLNKIVCMLEANKTKVVQCYPRHLRGSDSLLGNFYRASSAGSILCLKGRSRLNLAPIIYGSCFLMDTELAKCVGFYGNSVTEDINFSIRAYQKKDFFVSVCPEIYIDGGCPATFSDFVNQQVRWCEGTTRDVFRSQLKTILKMKSIRKKWDLLINGLHYSSGFFLLWTFIASLFGTIDVFIGGFVAVYATLGFTYPLLLGAQLEHYSLTSKIKALFTGFAIVYIMCPVMAYGFVKGLTKSTSTFKVTNKK